MDGIVKILDLGFEFGSEIRNGQVGGMIRVEHINGEEISSCFCIELNW